jgi:hypothetical protein
VEILVRIKEVVGMNPSKITMVLTVFTVVCLVVLSVGIVSAETQPLSFKGTVNYINLEGGFWGIVSDDGRHYDPINLAEEFQQEGLRVQVEAVVKNCVGIHMWGTIIEITAINKVEL